MRARHRFADLARALPECEFMKRMSRLSGRPSRISEQCDAGSGVPRSFADFLAERSLFSLCSKEMNVHFEHTLTVTTTQRLENH